MTSPVRSLSILMPAFGSAGDVNPFIGLALALQARGHRPRIIASAHFRQAVEGTGVAFTPFGDTERFDVGVADARLWDPREGFRFLMERFTIPAMRPLYELIAAEPRQDLVLAASYLAFGARLAAERLDIPLATVHLQPSVFASLEDTPRMPALPELGRLPRFLKRWLLDLVYLRVVDPVVAGPLNALRAELGLPPVRDVLRGWVHSPGLSVCLFPHWFAPRRADWPASSVTTDFVWQDGGGVFSPELRAFLDEGSRPLVFTAGSAMLHARNYFQQAVQAAQLLDMRAVLVARAGEQVPETLPPGVLHVAYAPFGQLFGRAALVAHHGGIGTTAQCLRAGVPQLVTPFNFDQPDNARILRRLGVAEVLVPARFQARRAASAICGLLKSQAVAQSCARLSRLSAAGPGAQAAAERIEALGLAHSS